MSILKDAMREVKRETIKSKGRRGIEKVKKHLVLLMLLMLSVSALAQQPVAETPRSFIDTTYAQPNGAVWAAHTSAQFSSALTASAPGDTIVLDAGVTYIGNFTFPVKANPNNQWIYIVSSALASLPAQGTRVVPATDAANMPKLVSTGVTSVITIRPGANYYRLVGLEITTASTQGGSTAQNPYTTVLVNAMSSAGNPLVDSITIDRCYIHASPTVDAREGFAMNASNVAIVDSYVSDIHQSSNDSQAVVAWDTPGPMKIVNNYLESTGENILFGGAGGLNHPWVPSDIEIRGNYLFKPLSWVPLTTGPPASRKWVVKNLFEIKSAQRVLVDSNVMENNWVSGQVGFAVALTVRTNSSGILAVVDDITFTNNIVKNVASGITLLAKDDQCQPANGCTNPGELNRVVIDNNLILFGDTTQPGYAAGYNLSLVEGMLITPYTQNLRIQHNSWVPPPNLGYCLNSLYFETNSTGPPTPPVSRSTNLWVLDNVLCDQIWGPLGHIGENSYTLTDYMGDPAPPEPRLLGNVSYVPTGQKSWALPPHNYNSTSLILFNADFSLNTPNWTDTSDGTLAGVNPAWLLQPPPVLTPAQVAAIQAAQAQITASTQTVANDTTAAAADLAAVLAAQVTLNTENAVLASDQATLAAQQSAYQAFLSNLCISQDGHTYQVGFVNGYPVCVLIH